jgi:uncharacterized protein (TIGR02145 family)
MCAKQITVFRKRRPDMRGLVLTTAAAICLASCGSGTLIDERDGKTYKTVKIGRQTWMARNLDYKTDNSWCYENSADSCDKYGRLYTWNAAKTACPAGYHLPYSEEWDSLAQTVGDKEEIYEEEWDSLAQTMGDKEEIYEEEWDSLAQTVGDKEEIYESDYIKWRGAGKNLKTKKGWNKYKIDNTNYNGNGTNAYGFSALPGGSRLPSGYFITVGYIATWWMATESDNGNAYHQRVENSNKDLSRGGLADMAFGFSVRCVADRP